jgi:lactate permease
MEIRDFIRLIVALLPICWLLVGIGVWKIPTHLASSIALLASAVLACSVFGLQLPHLVQASLEGLMLALHPILWVIISALFVYNMTLATGSMEKIKTMLAALSPDRRIQVLLLAFGFGGFLEAVAGFGTAVAIPAGILAAMGFNPFLAAVVCLIANTVPVAFGVLGVPITTLAQVTSLPLSTLAIYTALQLFPFVILLPLTLVSIVTGSIRDIRGVSGVAAVSGLAFAVGQILAARFIGPELAAVLGSLLALAVIVGWVRLFPIRKAWRFAGEADSPVQSSAISPGEAIRAWSPYLLILALVLATRFLPFFGFLFKYPFVVQKQFYFGQDGKPVVFQLAAGAGTVLFVSAWIGGLLQDARPGNILRVLFRTVVQLKKTILTVAAIVMVAKIMGYSGMTASIAAAFAAVSGMAYPFLAPLIGAIGTFITGSDTSANVLFGNLQKQAALQLGMNPEWLTAANASGATAGKMISPQSMAIAAASTGLERRESGLLRVTIRYCAVYVLLLGILVFIWR